MAIRLSAESYRIGWICAITTEFVAARQFLQNIHERPDFQHPDDTNNYTLGDLHGHNVVIAVLPNGEYGTDPAAGVATHMLRTFPNIRYGLMVGVGGGAPRQGCDIRLGDVVVGVASGEQHHGGVVQYDYGKSIQSRTFQMTRFLNQPPVRLRTAVNHLKALHEAEGNSIAERIDAVLQRNPRLKNRGYLRPGPQSDCLYLPSYVHDGQGLCADVCPGNGATIVPRRSREASTGDEVMIHYGLIGSANQLMKDAVARDALATERGILCFEMEAAGLLNTFPCLVIRGICDYADSHKNKSWQGYAALVAAAYAAELLNVIAPATVDQERKIQDVLSTISQDLSDAKNTSKNISTQVQRLEKELACQGEETRMYLKRKRSEDDHQLEFKHLLASLYFPTMTSRQDNLHGPYEGTFDWIFEPEPRLGQPGALFDTWLRADDRGPFWVNGKAGSGKSTLMSFLSRSTHLESGLEQWTGGNKLIKLSFFFWRAGIAEQRNINGLLRSLLHQLLTEYPNFAKLIQLSDYQRRNSWPNIALISVLKRLISHAESEGVSIFMLIDGLDEFEGDATEQSSLLRVVMDLALAASVKAVVSSRPEPLFEDRLSPYANIRLQDLNIGDIREYVEGKLLEESIMQEKQEQKPKTFANFVDDVARKADGVFLWVRLAVSDLLKGVWARDSFKMLRQRLQTLDPTLQGLFPQLLQKLDHVHAVKAATYLQSIRTFGRYNHLTVLDLVFACEPRLGSRVKELGLTKENNAQTARAVENCVKELNAFGTTLRSQCAGLLDVNLNYKDESSPSRLSPHLCYENDRDMEPRRRVAHVAMDLLCSTHVEVVHRSVWEFLDGELEGVDFLSKAKLSDQDKICGLFDAYEGLSLLGFLSFIESFALLKVPILYQDEEEIRILINKHRESAFRSWVINLQYLLLQHPRSTERFENAEIARLDGTRHWLMVCYEQLSIYFDQDTFEKDPQQTLDCIDRRWTEDAFLGLQLPFPQNTWALHMLRVGFASYVLPKIDDSSYEPWKDHIYRKAVSGMGYILGWEIRGARKAYYCYAGLCGHQLTAETKSGALWDETEVRLWKQREVLASFDIIAKLLHTSLKTNETRPRKGWWRLSPQIHYSILPRNPYLLLSESATHWERFLACAQGCIKSEEDFEDFSKIRARIIKLAKTFLSSGANPNALLTLHINSCWKFEPEDQNDADANIDTEDEHESEDEERCVNSAPWNTRAAKKQMLHTLGHWKIEWNMCIAHILKPMADSAEITLDSRMDDLFSSRQGLELPLGIKVASSVDLHVEDTEYSILTSFNAQQYRELWAIANAHLRTFSSSTPFGTDSTWYVLNDAIQSVWYANQSSIKPYTSFLAEPEIFEALEHGD